MKKAGLKIKSISRGSFFRKSGLKCGDLITHVNGEPIYDDLDFKFFAADSQIEIIITRNGRKHIFSCQRPAGTYIDLEFFEKPINRCTNRCIFCFIDQMPPGLRKGLYIKDEDVKHSFINGNYVTLSSLTYEDLKNIARLGISPLYISVHATDPIVRSKMLGNRKAPPIMQQLRFLKNNYIYLHTQIVLCPGYNDGKILRKTIKDLFSLGDVLQSIAVVPVGITKFRKSPLRAVDKKNALQICTFLNEISDAMLKKDGKRRLFCADELYLCAGLNIPTARYYEDYPQIENGVGLIRLLLEEWKQCKKELRSGACTLITNKSLLVITSVSAFSHIKKICSEAVSFGTNLTIDVIPIVNSFFGESVTVAGLLTAKDILTELKKSKKQYTQIVIPSVMFNYAGATLDGYSIDRLRKISGKHIKAAQSIHEVFCI